MMKITMPSMLEEDDKVKFELLKDRYGVFGLLRELDRYGYRPDDFTAISLDEAIRKLFDATE